jgi:phage tail-like protein
VKEAALMLRSTARSKVTWAAMIAALVVGLALLLMLTSPSFHPKPAQAQSATTTVLTIDGFDLATFSKVDEATSSIKLPQADGTAAKLNPISIVLERTATNSTQLSSWHRQASTQSTGTNNYRKDATLTVYDSSGTPTLKLFLKNAWPAEYQLEQQGTEVVERVTLTAAYFERVPAP